jgi:RNA polymerase sigma factor (sigma-70 family)
MARSVEGGRPQHVPLPVAAGADRAQLAGYLAEVEPMVRSICRRQLGHDRGDDAAQTVLLRIWERLSTGCEFDDLRAYAAVSSTFAARPKPTRKAVPVGDTADSWADQISASPVDELLRAEEAGEAAAKVAGLLDRLTPREAEVVRARSLQERPTSEVAAELGIQPKSVRSAQLRAMARMREICGARSPNPLASNLPMAERERIKWQRIKARKARASATPADDAAYIGMAGVASTRTAEEAAHVLAHDGRSLDEARAMVGEYLDAASARARVAVHAGGLDDADIACLDGAGRPDPAVPGAAVAVPQPRTDLDAAEVARRDELSRWHAQDLDAGVVEVGEHDASVVRA